MSKRLLIVHPDPLYLDELRYSFEADGYVLFTAKSIEEGMDKIHREKPNMILMEMLFEDGNGLDFVKAIKDERIFIMVILTREFAKVLAFGTVWMITSSALQYFGIEGADACNIPSSSLRIPEGTQ